MCSGAQDIMLDGEPGSGSAALSMDDFSEASVSDPPYYNNPLAAWDSFSAEVKKFYRSDEIQDFFRELRERVFDWNPDLRRFQNTIIYGRESGVRNYLIDHAVRHAVRCCLGMGLGETRKIGVDGEWDITTWPRPL